MECGARAPPSVSSLKRYMSGDGPAGRNGGWLAQWRGGVNDANALVWTVHTSA